MTTVPPPPPQVVDCFALQPALWALWFRSKPICQRFILIMNCWWNIFDHFVYTSHTRKKEIVVNLLIFLKKKKKKSDNSDRLPTQKYFLFNHERFNSILKTTFSMNCKSKYSWARLQWRNLPQFGCIIVLHSIQPPVMN